ncbi:MAG: hypothetical protein HY286_14550 [Planctomycetes bacterium]|nr:hypothetical protein [Planctomycetota bacterium]
MIIKSFIFVGAALAGLVVWDVVLTLREEDARRNIVRIGRLFTKEEREVSEPRGFVFETQTGAKFIYKKTGADEWRCTSYKNAVASTEHIERGLFNKIFESEGNVQSDDSKLAAQYGFDVPAMYRVTIHGPGIVATPERPDPIASVEIGAAVHDKEGSYMRRTGDKRIWFMDSNPHPELDRPAGMHIPPLIDPSMVPMYWLGRAQRVKIIKIEKANDKAFELEVRDKQISPEEMRAGKSPFEWYFKQDGNEKLCEQSAALGFTSLLMRAPYSDIVDVALYNSLGFDKPIAKITLTPQAGEPLEIFVGSVGTPNKKIAVYNVQSQLIFECEPQIAGLLFPKEQMLYTPGQNPWKQINEMMQPK